MERLTFNSAEALDAYCDQVRTDLRSRGEEQRRLVELSLQRLDELASQANAMHSDELAAEITARREEGQKLLARLSTLAPPNELSAPIAPVDLPVPQANGLGTLGPSAANGATPAPALEQSVSDTAASAQPQSEPVPAPAFGAPFESGAPQVEALWEQPVDSRTNPEGLISEVPDTFATAAAAFGEPIVTSATPPPDVAPAPLLAWSFAPVQEAVSSEAEQAFGIAAAPAPEATEPQTLEALLPSARQETKSVQVPSAINWSWGSESESPAWAELLVEDAPVPMEPLTDSHFGRLPSSAEIANAAPIADAPPEPDAPASGPRPLVLNVKVGEWGSEHPLSKPELFIGRRDLATRCMPDVEVPYDQAVSRRHLRIAKDNGSYFVEDLESTNGTTLNGRSLRPGHPEKLQAGDELEIGEFTLLKIATV